MTDEMREAGFDSPIKITASDPLAFDECMYILLCGTGVGFSVERQYISTLPVVGHALPRKMYLRTDDNFPGVAKEELSTYDRKTKTINVADSKYGWASAVRILIVELSSYTMGTLNCNGTRVKCVPLDQGSSYSVVERVGRNRWRSYLVSR